MSGGQASSVLSGEGDRRLRMIYIEDQGINIYKLLLIWPTEQISP